AWRAKYEPWSLDSIQGIYAQFEQKETLADQLRARIDQSIPFIEETKKGLDTLKLSKVDLEKRLVQLQTSYQGQTELWKEKQARLTMWIGHDSADQRIADTEAELQRIRSREAETRQQWE